MHFGPCFSACSSRNSTPCANRVDTNGGGGKKKEEETKPQVDNAAIETSWWVDKSQAVTKFDHTTPASPSHTLAPLPLPPITSAHLTTITPTQRMPHPPCFRAPRRAVRVRSCIHAEMTLYCCRRSCSRLSVGSAARHGTRAHRQTGRQACREKSTKRAAANKHQDETCTIESSYTCACAFMNAPAASSASVGPLCTNAFRAVSHNACD